MAQNTYKSNTFKKPEKEKKGRSSKSKFKFDFLKDPRLKLATCAAWVSYARMDAEYARQAYYGHEVPRHDPAYGAVFAPLYGETARLTLRLRERVPAASPEPWPTQ